MKKFRVTYMKRNDGDGFSGLVLDWVSKKKLEKLRKNPNVISITVEKEKKKKKS